VCVSSIYTYICLSILRKTCLVRIGPTAVNLFDFLTAVASEPAPSAEKPSKFAKNIRRTISETIAAVAVENFIILYIYLYVSDRDS